MNSRLPDSSTKSRCPSCNTKLRRNKFFHTTYDDSMLDALKESEDAVFKVFDHIRDDFDSLINYNFFLEERDTLVYNLTNKVDVHNQKKKLKDHKELKAKHNMPKRRKIDPDAERRNKQKYIIEEFKRLRTRMVKRENLTLERLQGAVTAEDCQKKGHQIEEEDFKAAQTKRAIILKRDGGSSASTQHLEYRPSAVTGMGGAVVEFVAPEPVQKDLADKIVATTKDGAMANLPAWNILTPEQQLCSKNASGWSFMDFFERARQEAFGSLT